MYMLSNGSELSAPSLPSSGLASVRRFVLSHRGPCSPIAVSVQSSGPAGKMHLARLRRARRRTARAGRAGRAAAGPASQAGCPDRRPPTLLFVVPAVSIRTREAMHARCRLQAAIRRRQDRRWQELMPNPIPQDPQAFPSRAFRTRGCAVACGEGTRWQRCLCSG